MWATATVLLEREVYNVLPVPLRRLQHKQNHPGSSKQHQRACLHMQVIACLTFHENHLCDFPTLFISVYLLNEIQAVYKPLSRVQLYGIKRALIT